MASRITDPPAPATNTPTDPEGTTSSDTGAETSTPAVETDGLDSASEQPQVHLSGAPAPGARPDPPTGERTLWLGVSGGGSGVKLGDAETYASGARALGLSANWLAERYPELNENFFYRFAELSASAAVTMPWMIYNHELGHASVARSFGWEADVEMTGWLSGVTHYTFDADGYTPEERLRAAAGGVNRSTSNAEYMAREWSRNGAMTLQESVAYLAARADLPNYLQKTVRLQNSGDPIAASNDIASVERLWHELGKDFSARQMLTVSLASHLLSAADWAAVIGAGRFLATGDRSIELPTFEIGGVSMTPPLFSAYLTTQGPLLGGTMTFNPDREMPFEVDFAGTIDGSAFHAGAKLFELPVTDGITVNPFVGVSQSDEQGLGYRLGTEARWDISKNLSVKARVSFNQRDLMTEAYGESEGVNLGIHFGWRCF